MEWKLIDDETGEPINLGDTVTTFRNERAELVWLDPPHKPDASGRVIVRFEGDPEDRTQRFYCSVIGAHFVRVTD